MLKKTIGPFVLAAAAAGGLASLAIAHGMAVAHYGGQVTEVGDYRVEFIVRDGGIRAWVRDHADQPKAATGKAVLLNGGVKFEVPLKTGVEMLAGEAPVRAADRVTAVLSLTVDGKPVSARFAQEALVTPELSPQAAAGREAFQAVCAKCHGAALRGTDNGPPLLHPMYAPGSGHGDDVILAAMKNGAPQHMWKFGPMPKPDLPAGREPEVLAYIRAMQAANGVGAGTAGAMSMDHGMGPMDPPMDHAHHGM